MAGSMSETKRLHGSLDFPGVEMSHSLQDSARLAGFLADFDHLDHDAGNLAGMTGKRFRQSLAAFDRFGGLIEDVLYIRLSDDVRSELESPDHGDAGGEHGGHVVGQTREIELLVQRAHVWDTAA